MSKLKMAGIAAGVVVLVGVLGWVTTAPYLGNQGLARMPGVFIGGTDSPVPSDLMTINDHRGPMLMKLGGFPPMVNYLSFVATPEGIISATRPDGGYWAQRVRDDSAADGWLRFGDETYAMDVAEIVGADRLAMMAQWAAKSGRPLNEPLYPGSEPLNEWEVFFWTPK